MPNPTETTDELEEVRGLLLGGVREQLHSLKKEFENRERHASEVAGVLPQAARLCTERGDEFSRALQPVVGESLMETIKRRPQIFIESFHPIIGPLLRRSIAESLRGLMQSLNQRMDHIFSLQGMKWRFEAWRTGRSFAEVVLLKSLIYRVEQVFLIHRETGLLLLHAAADGSDGTNSDMVAGMLSAIQDFSRDSFHSGADATLEEFRVGEMEVWIAPGQNAYVAAVIRGNPTRELRTVLDEFIENVHILKLKALEDFQGDTTAFEPLRPDLQSCLRSQFQERTGSKKSMAKAWGAVAVVMAAVLLVTFFAMRNARRWELFLLRMGSEPGIAVTDVQRHWFSTDRISGLRDPLARDPMLMAAESGLDANRIRFNWKEYIALDATSVRRRFEQRFGLPEGVRIAFSGNTLDVAGTVPYEWMEQVRKEGAQVPGVESVQWKAVTVTYDPARALERFKAAFPPPPGLVATVAKETLHLSGMAPYEWISAVREQAARLPGISAIADRELRVTFDPPLVLRRFEEQFGIPERVTASIRNGVLALSGETSHVWLARVRHGARKVPGVVAVDETQIVDADEAAFRQSKAVLEHASVQFAAGKDEISAEGYAKLSRLSGEIRRAQAAARWTGDRLTVEVTGSTDSVGSPEANRELSENRARNVHAFLVSCGLDPGILKPAAIPMVAGKEGKSGPEESARCVTFRIVSEHQDHQRPINP